jgi:hypothetical protein
VSEEYEGESLQIKLRQNVSYIIWKPSTPSENDAVLKSAFQSW